MPAEIGDRAALAMLIEHESYGCDYAGGDFGAAPALHGPYRRDEITVGFFHASDAVTEEACLRVWAERFAELPERVRVDFERELSTSLRRADIVYRLAGLGQEAFHDWGGVHDEFHEVVIMNRGAGVLALVVASDD